MVGCQTLTFLPQLRNLPGNKVNFDMITLFLGNFLFIPTIAFHRDHDHHLQGHDNGRIGEVRQVEASNRRSTKAVPG